MVLDHVGISNKDEDSAVRFYRDLLGLEKIKDSAVEPDLSRKLFSVDRRIKMLVYGNNELKIEIFIVPGFAAPSPPIPHFCLKVNDFNGFLKKAKQCGVNVIAAERGGRTVFFVEDFSGNRIEIK